MNSRKLLTFSLLLGIGIVSAPSLALAKQTGHQERQEMYQHEYTYENRDRNQNRHETRNDKRYEDRRNEHGQNDNENYNRGTTEHHTAYARFDDQRRDRIRAYLRESYRSNCPPGLAKKHNRCQPPGQAKRYVVGDFLPPTYRPLPQGLLVEMGPPPPGTFYTMVDKDVLLVTEATRKILDAVTLLSAMD